MKSSLVRCNYVILCFEVKIKLLTKFSIFREIKLKFGGGSIPGRRFISHVNFTMQNEFDKNKGVLCHFLLNLFNLCSIKALSW